MSTIPMIDVQWERKTIAHLRREIRRLGITQAEIDQVRNRLHTLADIRDTVADACDWESVEYWQAIDEREEYLELAEMLSPEFPLCVEKLRAIVTCRKTLVSII